MIQEQEILNYLLSWIDRGKPTSLQSMVEAVLQEVWHTFHKISASKTGRYHPKESNYRPYGLINHTIRVLWLAKELCREEGLNADDTDEVLAAAILHDIGKIHYYNSGWGHIDHGKLGAQKLEEHNLPKTVVQMVECHMAHWEGKELTTIQDRILAYADYLASRKEVRIEGLKAFRKEEGASNEGIWKR